MKNKALLQAAWDYIKTNPEDYDQANWIKINCGTTGCIAYHVARLAGAELRPLTTLQELEKSRYQYIYVSIMKLPTGNEVFVYDFAANELGLTRLQEDVLFFAWNTLDDMELIVTALLNDTEIPYDDLSHDEFSQAKRNRYASL